MKQSLIRNKKIRIFGGGLIGLNIAFELSRTKDVAPENIEIYEKSKSILSAWDSVNFDDIACNNGFHGIETPRAEGVIQLLKVLGCSEELVEINNRRIICINGEEIEFGSSLANWPIELRRGLDGIIKNDKKKMSLNKNEMMYIIGETELGKVIKGIYNRFAGNIDDCWHLVYPWFFPNEFLFEGNDEGAIFQNKVRNNEINPKYILPKKGLFSSLVPLIEDQLKRMRIKTNLNINASFNEICSETRQESAMTIWCASSFGVLKHIDKKLANACITDCRHMRLILLSMGTDNYFRWSDKYDYQPTELLFMDETIPTLNRVSFPQQPNLSNKFKSSKVYLLAEYFSESRDIERKTVEKVRACLEKLFACSINIEGSIYGRPMYNFSEELYYTAKEKVEDFAIINNLHIPEIYFGPINMAKCAMMSESFLRRTR